MKRSTTGKRSTTEVFTLIVILDLLNTNFVQRTNSSRFKREHHFSGYLNINQTHIQNLNRLKFKILKLSNDENSRVSQLIKQSQLLIVIINRQRFECAEMYTETISASIEIETPLVTHVRRRTRFVYVP